MRTQEAKYRISVKEGAWLAVLALLGGGIFGALGYVVTEVAYLIVLFPVGLGFACGVFMWWVVTSRKIRSAGVAAVVATVLALAAYGTFQYANYLNFRGNAYDIVMAYSDRYDTSDIVQLEQFVDEVLLKETGSSGFVGYIKLSAQFGLEIAWLSFGFKEVWLDLGLLENQVLFWVYKLIELDALVGFAVYSAMKAASRPFCAKCETWLDDAPHVCPMEAPSLEHYVSAHESQQAIHYGGFLRRLAAALIDGALLSLGGVLFGLLFIGGASLALAFAGMSPDSAMEVAKKGSLVAGGLAAWLYFALMESSSRQATLGKAAVGLLVTDQQGQQISFLRATARFWGKAASASVLGIGLMMAAFTRKKQAMHDVIAGTLVVMGGG